MSHGLHGYLHMFTFTPRFSGSLLCSVSTPSLTLCQTRTIMTNEPCDFLKKPVLSHVSRRRTNAMWSIYTSCYPESVLINSIFILNIAIEALYVHGITIPWFYQEKMWCSIEHVVNFHSLTHRPKHALHHQSTTFGAWTTRRCLEKSVMMEGASHALLYTSSKPTRADTYRW